MNAPLKPSNEAATNFVRRHIGPSPRDIDAMLETVGAKSLSELDYEGTHCAIAVNFDVVPKSAWAQTPLKSGDEIEIITPRQGG